MKNKNILSKVISLMLCILVLLGSVTTAYGNTDVDGKNDNQPKISFLFAFLKDKPDVFGGEILSILIRGTEVNILSYSGAYIYVEDVKTGKRGYAFYWFVDDKFEFNRDYDHVYAGQTNSGRLKLKNGADVEWTVNPSGYISIDPKTKIITGIKPGTVTVTAKGGMRNVSCTVTCINPWKEPETSTTENTVTVFKNAESSLGTVGTVPKGTLITAKGDLADGSGWIYVNSGDIWGFIKLSDFPGIDYLLTEYHYYDQGYNIRFGSAESKIYDYASVLNDVMMVNFKLKVCPYVYPYTSAADKCKIWRYGSVKSNNLTSSCPKNKDHDHDSCLRTIHMRDILLDDKGWGTDVLTKSVWTGHIMDGHAVSNSEFNSKTLVFTTANTVSNNSGVYSNKSSANIRYYSLYELTHETGHQLGLNDGYCFKDFVNGTCSNENCFICRKLPLPNCIMAQIKSPTNSTNMFCDDCKEKINSHLKDHH